ncbi:GntR family transcriptional regulator [Brevundimonas lutea]|uniref:GntR family transcriptional regulator n=1 Tax=Brevundimonas lutea TaxID=2293980 RepID=UPI000F0355A9|nr:GntR family transcriptional regulator [Brevundimonas lutea]
MMMARDHEPYAKALAALRERIASGVLNGGDPVVVMLEAEALDLSPTPLREALARLEGEGLVRRVHRGGYRVAHLGAGEIAEHYRFQARLVATSLALAPPPVSARSPTTPAEASEALAGLLGDVVRGTGDRALLAAWLASTGRLERVRRREAARLDGLVEEHRRVSAALAAGTGQARTAVAGAYDRRIEAAGRLSDSAASTG